MSVHLNKAGGDPIGDPFEKRKEIDTSTKPSASLNATTDSSLPSLYNLFEKGKGFLSTTISSFSNQFKASTSLPKDSLAVETMVQDSQNFPLNSPPTAKDLSVKSVREEISAAKDKLAHIKKETKIINSAIKKERQGLKEKGVSSDRIELRERLLDRRERQYETLLLRSKILEKHIRGLEQSIPFLEKMEEHKEFIEKIKKLHPSS